LAGCVAAAVLTIALASGAMADESPAVTLRVLTYNVHGLFRLAAKDKPAKRMPIIGWLSRPYDLILYQEDFEYHETLTAPLDQHRHFRGGGVGGDLRRILAKIVATPFTMWVPHFSPPYGSGVSTAVQQDLAVVESSTAYYENCHAWFGGRADCWATKGYLRVRLQLPGGGELDVYNTHLDSGADKGSIAARRGQLDELARAIETDSGARAVIVGGDLNLSYLRPRDRDMLRAFRARVGLDDSGAGPENPHWRERDILLYRSGDRLRLEVTDAGEVTDFVRGHRALSDHPALFATFLASPTSP